MRDCMDQPTTRLENRSMAARAKAFVSEQAIEVVNDALQMFGAKGYGNEVPLQRMYRDVRMFTIGGGTAQILKTQVAGALWGGSRHPRPAMGMRKAEQVTRLETNRLQTL